MRKYNVGYHGPKSGRDLQGIAALTNNPLAVENISRQKSREAAIQEVKHFTDVLRQNLEVLTGIPKDSVRMHNLMSGRYIS